VGDANASHRRTADPSRETAWYDREDVEDATEMGSAASHPAIAQAGEQRHRTSVGAMVLSIQAMAWAIQQQEVTEPVTRFVLLCLANYAGSDGNSACPSVLRLARDTGLSERAVQLHLRKLESLALIRKGNPAFAAAKISRADRRPVVYNILIERGAPDAPRRGERGAPRDATGCTGQRHGVNVTMERGERGAPDPKDLSEGEPKSVEIDVSEAKKKATEEIRRLADRLRVIPTVGKRQPN
jgi:hypothetical protein